MLAALNVKLPPVVRPALEASVVDVAEQPGAAIVRSEGVAAAAGLAVGDVIVSAAGSPVASVADLRAKVMTAESGGGFAIDVRNSAGVVRPVKVSLATAADTLPLTRPGVYRQPATRRAARVSRVPRAIRWRRQPRASIWPSSTCGWEIPMKR